MSLVTLTRPDDSPVAINPDIVLSLADVPASGPLAGPLKVGTRITFANQTHQDVKELLAVVTQKINDARSQHIGAFAAAMRSSLASDDRPSAAKTSGAKSSKARKP